jgi:hypothetical protein
VQGAQVAAGCGSQELGGEGGPDSETAGVDGGVDDGLLLLGGPLVAVDEFGRAGEGFGDVVGPVAQCRAGTSPPSKPP